jgi:hypothetical protein
MPELMAYMDKLGQSLLVLLAEELVPEWHSEESCDIVPIFLYDMLSALFVDVPILLELPREQLKLLIVGVFLDGCRTLEAVDDQLQTDLRVPHADCHVLLEELRKALSAEFFPFAVQSLHQFLDLLLVQLQEIAVGGVEEPILHVLLAFDSDHEHPVVGDGKHESNDQGLLLLILSEVRDQAVQLSPLLLRKQQVLVLELPREGEELEMVMVAKNGEVGRVLQTKPVISSFEIAMKDVVLTPRPFVSQLMLLFDVEQEPFNPPFE